jgi:hypothetical protein
MSHSGMVYSRPKFGHLAGWPLSSSAASVHQNLHQLKINDLAFWGQILCLIFDAFSPIFPTDINEIKHFSILFIQLRFLIYGISPLDVQLVKREVILASISRRAGRTGIFHTWSPNRSRPVMKIRALFLGNYLRHHVDCFKIWILSLSFISKDDIQGGQ